MYPIKFRKVLKEKIWGGHKLEEFLGFHLEDGQKIGESWEVCSHENGMSIVENGELQGKSLKDLILTYKGEILGEEVYQNYHEKLPLLIKYLDINDRLSVQVHPEDAYAQIVEHEFGKAESWYIVDASPDAEIVMGLAEGIDKETFEKKVASHDFEGLFNTVKVKKGDFINVKPGLVHASSKGSVLICEIQQNSDVTYRIYDYDRDFNGEKRELHLDKAKDVIKYDLSPDIKSSIHESIPEISGYLVENLAREKQYKIDKIIVSNSAQFEGYKNFVILSIISGNGKIVSEDKEFELKTGDTYFIPKGLEYEIDGHLEMLKSFL